MCKRFKWIAVIVLLVSPLAAQEKPVVNIPPAFREANYAGGSCVHAAFIALLRWQGRYDMAEYWRKTYSRGEFPSSFAKKLDAENIRYAQTTKGNVEFLEWACETRRGCAVTVSGGNHMVVLVHIDAKWACLLDNNDISKFLWLPREKFLEIWTSGNQNAGWAVTPVYVPAAPLPYIHNK